jgi:glutaredoxin/glutathione-dependent peroxiredoxin
MPIKQGDRVPTATFKELTATGLVDVDSATLFKDKKVAVFALPGAYTPVCSAQHLPGFVEKAGALKQAGFDEIVCISVNDPFVMDAWGKSSGASGKVRMLADADGSFTRAMGLVVSLPAFGLGDRSERYSMVVQNGVIAKLDVEKSVLNHGVSSAVCMLGA